MNDPALALPGLSPVNGKRVEVRVDGELLSSDGGALALREVEKRFGVADRLAACLVDARLAAHGAGDGRSLLKAKRVELAAPDQDRRTRRRNEDDDSRASANIMPTATSSAWLTRASRASSDDRQA